MTRSDLPERKHPIHLPNVQRHNEPVIVFLTVCTHERRAILANEAMETLLVNAWGRAVQWRVGRYLLMPDHVHLFCSPAVPDAENVKDWAAYWKGLVSRGMQGHGPLAPGPRGSGPSRDELASGRGGTRPSRDDVTAGVLWQRDVWDTQLRDAGHYHEKWEYVRLNPVRKELVSDADAWPYQGELNVLWW